MREDERKRPVFEYFQRVCSKMAPISWKTNHVIGLVLDLRRLTTRGAFNRGFDSIEEAQEALIKIQEIRDELERITSEGR